MTNSNRAYQENTPVIANTLSHKTREDSPHGHHPDDQHGNQIDYTWRKSIESAKIRPGADCGSDHELLLKNSSLT